jgi:cysteine synthase A
MVFGRDKSALPSYEIGQLEKSLISAAPVFDLTTALGIRNGVLLALDFSQTVSGTHKGCSYSSMFLKAIKDGRIKEDTRIVEFTSGRGGEAAARIAKLLGLEADIVMPEGITPEREEVLRINSNLILTPESLWIPGSIARANEILEADPEHTFLINQSANPDNPKGIQGVVRAN